MNGAAVAVSDAMLARCAREWSALAGETVNVEHVKGAIYAFGSELACLRLAHKMRSFEVRYSENLGSWYFCRELRGGAASK
jgi:hypothetical protein